MFGRLKNYFVDCGEILCIIMITIVYGSGKDRKQIIKDMIDCESGLYD